MRMPHPKQFKLTWGVYLHVTHFLTLQHFKVSTPIFYLRHNNSSLMMFKTDTFSSNTFQTVSTVKILYVCCESIICIEKSLVILSLLHFFWRVRSIQATATVLCKSLFLSGHTMNVSHMKYYKLPRYNIYHYRICNQSYLCSTYLTLVWWNVSRNSVTWWSTSTKLYEIRNCAFVDTQ